MDSSSKSEGCMMEETDSLTQEKENRCGCSQGQQSSCAAAEKKEALESEKTLEEQEHPTRYGDWVKKGRCIDF